MENQEKERSGVKKLLPFIGAGVAVAVALWVVFKKPSFETQMKNAATEINKSCPVMLDEETRLDKAIAHTGNNVFQFDYTLVNLHRDSIDTNLAIQEIKPRILEGVKTNEDLKLYKDHKTTLSYNYKDKEGKSMFRINITPEMYK